MKDTYLHKNTPDEASKFKTKNWVEINDDTWGTYTTNNQIKFKTPMLKSSLYDYSDAYILIKRAIAITREGTDAAATQAEIKK